MPLIFANEGEALNIVRILGNSEQKKRLHELGFVEGEIVRIISQTQGNLIVNIKESRLAIGRDLAAKVLV